MSDDPPLDHLRDVTLGDLGPVRVELAEHDPDWPRRFSLESALQDAGYELRVREADCDEDRMLRTPDRDVHVHVFLLWSQEIDRYLTLRDHLIASPRERAASDARKRELAGREWPTMDHNAEVKGTLIEAFIAEAGGTAPRRRPTQQRDGHVPDQASALTADASLTVSPAGSCAVP